MNINQLKYFQTVCEFSNITKAAEKMHISQPSVSNAIKDLENELGVELFSRARNRLTLSPAGEFLLTKAKHILNNLDQLPYDIQVYAAKNRFILKTGISMAGIGAFLSIYHPTMKEFFSNVEFSICEVAHEELLRKIKENSLDCGITILDDYVKENFSYQFLKRSRICYCVNINNPLAKLEQVSITDLKDEPLLWCIPEDCASYPLDELCKKKQYEPDKLLVSHDIFLTKELLKSDTTTGVFILEDYVKDELKLRAIPLKENAKISAGFVWREDHSMNQKFNEFQNIIRELY